MCTPTDDAPVCHISEPLPVPDGWRAWQEQYTEFLTGNQWPLYAVPGPLVEPVVKDANGLLSAREVEIERSFAQFVATHHAVGVDHDHLIRSDLFSSRSPTVVSTCDFDALGWAEFGIGPEETNRLCEQAELRASLFREQLIAYAGWLITNPVFLSEVSELRSQEERFLQQEDHQPAAEKFAVFCSRWQLAGMSSWELPIPQGPNLSGIDLPQSLRAAGPSVALQFPFSVRLPARFPITALVTELRQDLVSNHLAEWQAVLKQESKRGVGLDRYRNMLRLQFYRNIVLESRYGERLRGRAEALDRAFGQFLGGLSEDSVKRLRLEIRRRLSTSRA